MARNDHGSKAGYGHTRGPQQAPVGQGGRFSSLSAKLASEPGVRNPQALAASIGRKKYGAAKMGQMAKNGEKDGDQC